MKGITPKDAEALLDSVASWLEMLPSTKERLHRGKDGGRLFMLYRDGDSWAGAAFLVGRVMPDGTPLGYSIGLCSHMEWFEARDEVGKAVKAYREWREGDPLVWDSRESRRSA